MSISIKNPKLRPGIVNVQGRLPDPSELVCIEVPKIFDQCLIKRCLRYDEGPDTITTDTELRSNPLTSPKRYIGSRDFSLTLNFIDEYPSRYEDNYKKLIISYTISFYSDYIDLEGNTRSELFQINRTDTIGKLYCPNSIAQISTKDSSNNSVNDISSNIIKLEMVADALAGKLVEEDNGDIVIDIILGYYIVVKCELVVQLLVPSYDYYPLPKEPCNEDPEEDPCERFEKAPLPEFYPAQNLKPLFSENNDYSKKY